MPTYDYECDACGHQFEVFQGINDEVPRNAPSAIKKEAEASVWFGRRHCVQRQRVLSDGLSE